MSMISPEAYVIDLKDADYETLIQERNDLIELIQDFEEKEKAGDRSGAEWNILPSPKVQYQLNLEYLSEICKLMAEKYNQNN